MDMQQMAKNRQLEKLLYVDVDHQTIYVKDPVLSLI